jgi:transcriptional regulator with XRE-family HTH domain
MVSALGEKITELQIEKGISNKELARRIGRKPQDIWRLKRVKQPQYPTLHKLAICFGVPSRVFLERDSN